MLKTSPGYDLNSREPGRPLSRDETSNREDKRTAAVSFFQYNRQYIYGNVVISISKAKKLAKLTDNNNACN